MACQALHAENFARAKTLVRVAPDLNCVPVQNAIAAQIVRNAIPDAGNPTHEQIAIASGFSAGSHGKVSKWLSGEASPGLLHLVRMTASLPRVVRAICRCLLAMCEPASHVQQPLPNRVCGLFAEVGDLSREIQASLSDGRLDDRERSAIRKEIGDARNQLDRLEMDLG